MLHMGKLAETQWATRNKNKIPRIFPNEMSQPLHLWRSRMSQPLQRKERETVVKVTFKSTVAG